MVLILFFGLFLYEMCCLNTYGIKGFNVYKSVFLGWVVGQFNIALNGELNCGIPSEARMLYDKCIKKKV